MLIDALPPIVVLIGLLALTIALFGVSATDGPLHVALLLSAAFASLIAFKNCYTVASVAEADVAGVTIARRRRAEVPCVLLTDLMSGLATARVPYGTYLKWVWPLLAMLSLLSILALGAGALVS